MNHPEPSDPPERSSPLSRLMGLTRWFSLVTVFSSLAGALMMFLIGGINTFDAIRRSLDLHPDPAATPHPSPRPAAHLLLLESLDNGLTGLTFLYFAYGIYALFLADSTTSSAIPRWLKVQNISALKRTLLEVVAVLLAIMFVRVLAERLLTNSLDWEMLVIPGSIVAIALAARLMFNVEAASSR